MPYPQLSQRDITDICGGLETADRVFGGPSRRSTSSSSGEIENTFDLYTIDFTPAEYITLLFTDLGAMTPAAVSDELIKLYQ
jgi:translation initiation factor 2B subunit (eIF-2B alpha/beta/delta family)